MAGKRVAGKQLHKHSMDRSDSESDCDDASFNQDRADVNRRVYIIFRFSPCLNIIVEFQSQREDWGDRINHLLASKEYYIRLP